MADSYRKLTSRFEGLLAAGRAWLSEHPDLADEAEKRGPQAVMEDFVAAKQ
jgi:hypothetical protein